MPRQSSNWTRVIPQVGGFNKLAQMVNSGMWAEPTPVPGSQISPNPGGVNVVPGQGGVTVIPTRPNQQQPSAQIMGGTGTRAGSMWNTARGGYTPMGPGYTGTPSVGQTNWTRDSSAPGGWVPRALPAGTGGAPGWGSYATNPITGAAVQPQQWGWSPSGISSMMPLVKYK